MKRSQELIQEESHYFAPAGRIPYYPLVIDHAHGSTLTDVDGNEYLDLLTSASALNVGHTPEPIVNTIIAQVKKMIHYTPAYMYHEPLVHLAKKMCEITPGDFEKRVRRIPRAAERNVGDLRAAGRSGGGGYRNAARRRRLVATGRRLL